MRKGLFDYFDFKLLDSRDFKEDAVREELIHPILKKLKYKPFGNYRIIRSKSLSHPFVMTGSRRRKIKIIPDYVLAVDEKYSWVLDAKGPDEEIKSGENVEQVYFYAIHPDIRVKYYALCNGREFILFQVDRSEALLYFHLSEIDKYWSKIKKYLVPENFAERKVSFRKEEPESQTEFDYLMRQALEEIPAKRQTAKRHYGVHPYFTKQVWNVVQEYIKNFTQPGDIVLDPFGGSGVTLVEALMLERKCINVDINPLAVFIVKNLVAPISIGKLVDCYDEIKRQFIAKAPKTKKEINAALRVYPYPKGIKLPKDSDVETVEELFSPGQLAQLAYLKHLIVEVEDDDIRGTLLLMFSGLLNKINLTYHASTGRSAGRGNSSVFAYYRYRMAPKPAKVEIMKYFESRLKRMIGAKKEMAPNINKQTISNAENYKGSATNLDGIASESIDYIYTDPPYGKKIQYLDLSTMWNAWLDLTVTEEDFELEAIEGGERSKSSDNYSDLLVRSIGEMYRVLKFGRWMSFVFAHKDPKYWHLIVETAEKFGFEYAGVVKQKSGQVSFKKRQNPFSVLSGQLIINFKKVRTPNAIQRIKLGADIFDIVIETIESVIAKNDGATLEEINDELIIKGLELGFLDILSKEYKDLTPILTDNFDYKEDDKKFHIRPNQKFKTNIPIEMRIRYFLLSYLKRKALKSVYPTTDEIILDIMPLLKNGRTPENQTILNVLEAVADRIGNDQWRLSTTGQLSLF